MLFLYTYVYVFLCTNNDVYNETSVMLSKTSAHCFIAEEVTTDNGLICGLAMLGKTKYQFYELFTVYSIQSLTQLASRVKKGGLIMARLILFILCALPVLFHFILFMLQYLVFVYIEK